MGLFGRGIGAVFRTPPHGASQPIISEASVTAAMAQKPRRVCFASTHQSALKRDDKDKWVGSFAIPFRESVYPIFYEMTALALHHSEKFDNWWRSVREDSEYEDIEAWIDEMGTTVFLRDQLALSIALAENQIPEGGHSPIGELEYRAKYNQDENAIETLTAYCVAKIQILPFYKDAGAICAVPPRPGKDFDLPSEIASRIAKELEIADLTANFSWDSEKPSMKEVPVSEKWAALETVGMSYTNQIPQQSVILLDDLYQSGITMQYVAKHVLAAGASRVFGLSVVKSRRDSDNQ